MIETPKSLTAIIHVKFNYEQSAAKTPDAKDIELLSNILDQTSNLAPEMQEIIAKFADYLGTLNNRAEPT